jgi:hypothetical protein
LHDLAGHHAARVSGFWHQYDEDADFPSHVHQRREVSVGLVGLRVPAVIRDVHAKAARTGRYGLADPTEPENPKAAPGQPGGQRKRAVAPATIADEAVRLRDAPADGEHQSNRQVGDIIVQHARRIRDLDAVGGREVHVDVVITDPKIRDQPEIR